MLNWIDKHVLSDHILYVSENQFPIHSSTELVNTHNFCLITLISCYTLLVRINPVQRSGFQTFHAEKNDKGYKSHCKQSLSQCKPSWDKMSWCDFTAFYQAWAWDLWIGWRLQCDQNPTEILEISEIITELLFLSLLTACVEMRSNPAAVKLDLHKNMSYFGSWCPKPGFLTSLERYSNDIN